MPADAEGLLVSNLALIERVIAFVCRRNNLDAADAEEFTSVVKVKLVEDDYAILKKFEGRSSLATYINVVVQRLLLDYRIHEWGKWHASAEAKRHGELAVELEKLLYRDGRCVDDALPELARRFPSADPSAIRALADRLPARPPRRRAVELSEARSVADERDDHSERVERDDRIRLSARLSTVMRSIIDRLPEREQLVLRLRFENGMTLAQISRALQEDQKQLYRRFEKQLREARAELERAGIAAADVLDLVGGDNIVLDFNMRKPPERPSSEVDGAMAEGQERSR